MRSAFVMAVNIDALKYEVNDLFYSGSRSGLSKEELDRLSRAASLLQAASEDLKKFRFIKKVEDLPEAEPPKKPKK